ncbi:MAG: TadE family protein [Thermoguttaceae bacterium]
MLSNPQYLRGPWQPRPTRTRPRGCRHAIAVLELVLVIPILILPMLAIIRFGLYYANMQQVTLASRIGAEEASHTAVLPASGGVPTGILNALNAQLETAGITPCRIRLEHNVNDSQVELISHPGGPCDCGETSNLGTPPPGKYVRLSICVPMSELVPQWLNSFGLACLDGADVVECTTVFHYEVRE